MDSLLGLATIKKLHERQERKQADLERLAVESDKENQDLSRRTSELQSLCSAEKTLPKHLEESKAHFQTLQDQLQNALRGTVFVVLDDHVSHCLV